MLGWRLGLSLSERGYLTVRAIEGLELREKSSYGKGPCCICGHEGSRCEAAFVKKRRSFHHKGATICGGCWEDAPLERIYQEATIASTA